MKIEEIRRIAKAHGINAFGKTKVSLVKEIQRKEGHFDCFATAIDYCDQFSCAFREACFKEAGRIIGNPVKKPGRTKSVRKPTS